MRVMRFERADPRTHGAAPGPEATVVAVDPGHNVGVAWVDGVGRALRLAILTRADLEVLLLPPHTPIVLGDGTGSRALAAILRARGFDPELVDETGTTLEARVLYFRDHPPRGVLRLLPPGLRSAPRPIDDYAAYAIALRWQRGRVSAAQERPPGA